MPFRARKSITIIPGLVKLNLSGTTGRNGSKGGMSWTLGLLGLATYNTRDGKWRVNTPGLGWWESSSRSQREKRKLQKRVAKAKPAAGGGSRPTGAGRKDAEAAHYARWFRALEREGVNPAQAARDAGRCPTCGHKMSPGQWCVPCAQKAAKRHDQAEARAAARQRQETRLYGAPSAPSGGQPGGRPDAIDQYLQAVEDGNMSPERRRLIGERPAVRCPSCGTPHRDGACPFCGPDQIESARRRAERACMGCGTPGKFPHCDPCEDQLARNRADMADRGEPIGEPTWLTPEARARLDERMAAEGRTHHAPPRGAGGQCGAKTQDGTPCRNGAGCSIRSHRRVLT